MLHTLFWENLSPDGGGKPEGDLAAAIDEYFGSFDRFQRQLSEATVTVQGSGWGTLAWEPLGQRLYVAQVYDHQDNIGQSSGPLLVLDAWEHAYYLQYKNERAEVRRGDVERRELGRRLGALRAGAQDRDHLRSSVRRSITAGTRRRSPSRRPAGRSAATSATRTAVADTSRAVGLSAPAKYVEGDEVEQHVHGTHGSNAPVRSAE